MKEQKEVRLAIIGAPNVGKSAIAVRFLTRRFIGEYEANMEFNYKREITFEDDTISYELKDTAGKKCLSNSFTHFSWASSIIVVYSIVERSSFITAAVMLEEFKRLSRTSQKQAVTSPTIAIFANKYDLCYRREVATEEGRNLALKHGASFYEISAAADYDNIFVPLNTMIIQTYIVITKEAMAEERSLNSTRRDSSNSNRRDSLYLPLIEESPSYDTTSYDLSSPTKKSPQERKQSVRRKLSAAIFKKRSETV